MKIKSTEYLYGINASEFAELTYTEALTYKYNKAKRLLYNLMEDDYKTRDNDRADAVYKAISHNGDLIHELNTRDQ